MAGTVKPDLTTQRVWANAATGGNITDPGTAKFGTGWALKEVPTFPNFNFIQQQFSQANVYNNEQGINGWDTNTIYPVGAIVKGSDGFIYRALIQQNGNDPTSSPTNWAETQLGLALNVLTVAVMTALTGLVAGRNIVNTAEFSTGNGGSGIYDVVLTSSVTPNTFNIIVGVADPLISFVLRILAETTVRQFGASPAANAATNAGAIQAWLDTTEGYLQGESGTYTVDTALTSGVQGRLINGNGMKILTDSTVNTSLLDLTADDQTVENFELQADAAAECSGINIGAFSNCEIRFCKLSNFDGSGGTNKGSGIICNSAGKDHQIHHNRVIDSHFSHGANQFGSIHCNAGGSLIESNIITECQQTGISVAAGSSGGSHHIKIINNTIVGKTGAPASGGINIDGYTIDTYIAGNNIRDVAVEGVLIAGSIAAYGTITSDVSIIGNTFHECVLNEFALQGNATGDLIRVLIGGNRVFRSTNTNQSIVSTNADHVDVLGNTIYGHDIGYTVTASSRWHNVNGNTFINQDNVGIAAFASNSSYTNNKIYGDGINTIGITFNALSTAGDLKLSDNTIKNCDIGIQGTFNPSLPVFVQNNYLTDNNTDLSYTGELADSSDGNRTDVVLAGEFTLVAGAASVSNSNLLADDKIFLFKKTSGGGAGATFISSKTAGAGFGVLSTSGTDTSTYLYVIDR